MGKANKRVSALGTWHLILPDFAAWLQYLDMSSHIILVLRQNTKSNVCVLVFLRGLEKLPQVSAWTSRMASAKSETKEHAIEAVFTR
jgi:hypothetical protein